MLIQIFDRVEKQATGSQRKTRDNWMKDVLLEVEKESKAYCVFEVSERERGQ